MKITMKRLYVFLAALVALPLVSCKRESAVSFVEGAPVEVMVSIRGSKTVSDTKVVTPAYSDESKVNSLQVFVFNGDELEAHRLVENSLATLIPATAGERSVWAVTNAPDIYAALNVSDSNPMTLPKLKAFMSNLTDNKPNGFVMVGSVTQELVDGGNVLIDVKRIVARVSISKISASLKDYREGYSVKINRLFLLNVPGNASLDFTAEPSLWLNKMAHVDDMVDALLCDSFSGDDIPVVKNNVYKKDGASVHEHEAYVYEKMLVGQYELAEGVTMEQENAYIKEHVFYSYPNKFGTDDGNSQNISDSWSPRGSVLVIEATMIEADGVTEHPGFYPIMLPCLERNKTYSIEEVRITRLPGDEPYKPIQTGESQVTVSVHDWELGLNLGTVNI